MSDFDSDGLKNYSEYKASVFLPYITYHVEQTSMEFAYSYWELRSQWSAVSSINLKITLKALTCIPYKVMCHILWLKYL